MHNIQSISLIHFICKSRDHRTSTMAPVKDAPLDALSITVSTESRTSKNSVRSISTAALLHNASVKSPRSAHAPSYEQMRTAASGESEMEKCDKILSNYRQEDVFYALMTHLKEREGELKRITEQRNLSLKLKLAAETANQQLQGALSIQRNLLHAKEITIKSLEDKLEKCLALTGGEDRIKELSAEVNSLNEEREKVKDAYHKVLTDKDDTIADLKAQLDETNEKLAKPKRRGPNPPHPPKLNSKTSKLNSKKPHSNPPISRH